MNQETSWSPGIDAKDRILRGRSSWSLITQAEWGNYIAVALMAVLVIGMFISDSGYGDSPFLTVVAMLIALDVIFLVLTMSSVTLRRRREIRAGYTTITNRYPEVDQIDPKSGFVVRISGEPLLDRAEYLRRIGLIRAFEADDESLD